MMRRTVLPLATAALLALSGSASAVTQSDYDVLVEGTASYSHVEALPVALGQWDRSKQASFRWRTHFPTVTFIGKKFGTSSQPTTTVSAITGRSHESFPTPRGAMTADCSGDALLRPAGIGWIGGSLAPDADPLTEDLGLRTIGDVDVSLPSCAGDLGGPELIAIDADSGTPGTGPFDVAIDLPHEAIDMGKIIHLLEGRATGTDCPGHGNGTVSCTLSWSGTATFVRTSQRELGPQGDDDDLIVPLPPDPRARPAPPTLDEDDLTIPLPPDPRARVGTRPAPPTFDEDDLIPLPPRGKLSADGAQAKLTLACAVGCAGTATAYPATRSAVAAGNRRAAARPLARVRFDGRAGRTTTIRLRFGAVARKQVKRAGGIGIVLRVTPRSGGTAVERAVVLRPRKGRTPRRSTARPTR